MAQIEIEVHIDSFSTHEIINELIFRMSFARISIAELILLKQLVNISKPHQIQGTLADQLKYEIFEEARDRFSIQELTERLKP